LYQLYKQHDKLRDEWTLHNRRQGSYQEQKRESKDPDIEEALSQSGHNDYRGTGGWFS
jgi:hypothetical protein